MSHFYLKPGLLASVMVASAPVAVPIAVAPAPASVSFDSVVSMASALAPASPGLNLPGVANEVQFYASSDLFIYSYARINNRLDYRFKKVQGGGLVSSSELISKGYKFLSGDRYHAKFKTPAGVVVDFSRS